VSTDWIKEPGNGVIPMQGLVCYVKHSYQRLVAKR
jgi:hypothetical protein